jgi:hypothetical protein
MKQGEPFAPKAYTVFVEIAPYPNCGFVHSFVSRVGPATTIEEAKRVIKNDKRNIADTFDGLFEPASVKARTYSVWKANWEQIEI